VVNVHQRAKVEEYGDELFIVARMADLGCGAATEQLSMFVGKNYVLTFQEEPGDCWDPVRERIRKGVGRIRGAGPDYLAYALLDASIDAYYPVLEAFGERLDALEDAVLLRPDRGTIDSIHAMKSELLLLRRAIWPHREAIAHLSRDSTPLVTEATRIYLRDCYDHVVQIVDLVETYRELTADLKDLYMSAVSNRINETMRVLTIISTIFIPITFIAGIYGMNFDPSYSPFNMPELRWYLGYPFALGLMAVTGLGTLFYVWWQGWLGGGAVKKP
jgi:magnesium transporter